MHSDRSSTLNNRNSMLNSSLSTILQLTLNLLPTNTHSSLPTSSHSSNFLSKEGSTLPSILQLPALHMRLLINLSHLSMAAIIVGILVIGPWLAQNQNAKFLRE